MIVFSMERLLQNLLPGVDQVEFMLFQAELMWLAEL